MKIVLFLIATVTLVQCRIQSRDILDVLANIHANKDFPKLSAEDQVLIVELAAAAETGTLARYIDRTGFVRVAEILNVIPDDIAKSFEQYLIEHLRLEYGNTTTTSTTTTTTTTTQPPTTTKPAVVGVGGEPSVGKRNTMDHFMRDPMVQSLTTDEKDFLLRLFEAADQHNLIDFITAYGMNRINELHLPVQEQHILHAFIMKEMVLESHHPEKDNNRIGHGKSGRPSQMDH